MGFQPLQGDEYADIGGELSFMAYDSPDEKSERKALRDESKDKP